MKLKHAVLAAAVQGPATRYELQVRAQELFPASALSSGGVYHAVDECEHAGHLARRDKGADDDVAVYELTPVGDSYMRAWMRKASEPQGVRDELRDQIAYSEVEDLPWLADEIRRHLRLITEQRAGVQPDTLDAQARPGIEPPWSQLRRPTLRTVELGALDGKARALRMALTEVVEEIEHQQLG
jgi:DNA-binding PadR family transcriptional regulator